MGNLILNNASKNHAISTVLEEKHAPSFSLLTESIAPNTLRAYISDLSMFCYWLLDEEIQYDQDNQVIQKTTDEIAQIILSSRVSDKTICKYLEEVAFKYKISTIKRKLASFSWVFGQLKIPDHTKAISVKDTYKGLRKLQSKYIADLVTAEEIKQKGLNEPKRTPKDLSRKPAPGFREGYLIKIIRFIDSGEHNFCEAKVLRDKALLTAWWAGAFRRSEIANLRWDYLDFSEQGVVITLPFSKTDQAGKGISKGIHYARRHPELCATTHLLNWYNFQKNSGSKYVFYRVSRKNKLIWERGPLTTVAIVRILRQYLNLIGVKDSRRFSGHSPRRGFVSDAYKAGVPTREIQEQGGWRSEAMLNLYIEQESVFDRNATKHLL